MGRGKRARESERIMGRFKMEQRKIKPIQVFVHIEMPASKNFEYMHK